MNVAPHAAVAADGIRQNPFAVGRVRPGAIPYRFATQGAEVELVDRMQRLSWRAAVVGPHGTGKSTLLATLIDEVRRRGVEVQQITLRSDARRLPRWPTPQTSGLKLLVIDGYEQLSWLGRWWVDWRSWRQGWGVLITLHTASKCWPTLWRTEPTLDDVRQLVRDDLQCAPEIVGDDEIDAAWQGHRPDVRETLFSLYDLFERRHRGEPPSRRPGGL